MSRKIYLIVGAAALAVGAAAMRLLALPPMLPDLDSVNFASSLSRFDLASQAPHFPGYPLYVLAARTFAALGAGELAALALPGIVLGAAAAAVMAWAVSTRVGLVAGFGAGALFAFAPMAALAGGYPTSDGAGVAALAIVLALHVAAGARLPGRADLAAGQRGQITVAGGGACPAPAELGPRAGARAGGWTPVFLGLAASAAIGFRPSLAPAVMLLWLALPGPTRLRWFAGAAAGSIAWLAPLVAITGAGPFAAIASGFLTGHGSTWGGTIASRPDLAGRLHSFAFDLFAANLAWPWPGAGSALRWLIVAGFAIPAIGLVGRWAGRGDGERRLLLIALLSCAPYSLWAFVGQNLEKPRHLLPLVPGVALAWAAALPALRTVRPAPAAIAAFVAACLVAIAVPVSVAQGREPSPAAALALGLRSLLEPEGAMLFTGQEGRLVERFAPEYRAGRIADPDRIEPEARRLAAAGVAVYVTSAAPGVSRLAAWLEPVATFPAPSSDWPLLVHEAAATFTAPGSDSRLLVGHEAAATISAPRSDSRLVAGTGPSSGRHTLQPSLSGARDLVLYRFSAASLLAKGFK